ncbi:right-handed parallel beta-helix repeat-containing protein [Glycomyces sp. L485]|uniref:carbohydrate-binding protein n=1 Tax=Glycomyces sp. L485 TaxID=2909235 RepID=UPI001F4B254F|nr:carbohydrate-binding protein [Glycomyces sp. L485]MCH7230871.1 right-handed parallel beta-helix repeat-containing protein [Glycomyces sp. L485]
MIQRSKVRVAAVAGLTGSVVIAATLFVMNGASAGQARYETEGPTATCDGAIESEHSGFSGSGYCNTANTAGAAAQFTFGTDRPSPATLGFRYANGGTSDRTAQVVVHGSIVESMTFAVTGDWDSWETQSLTVPLIKGSNTIKLVSTGPDGLPNIDFLDVSLDATTRPQPSPVPNALFVAPTGTDDAAGTESDPTTLISAIDRITPGRAIYMRGGTYEFSQTVVIELGNNGTAQGRNLLSAYPGEIPVLDFSAQAEDSANRGLAVNADYWHIYGIVVERAGDNGIFVSGSDNIFERTVTRFNRDTGLQLSRRLPTTPDHLWPSDNLILSALSHDNADSDGEDADGFAAKLTSGPGNVFRYSVAHNNIDDGWDLFTRPGNGAIGEVTIEDSLAYGNGTLSDGTQNPEGDRNGFKLGGSDIPVGHTIRRNIAYDNGQDGFTYNSNPGTMTIANNLSIGSAERNFAFDVGASVFRDNTSCDGGADDEISGDADDSNQFWTGSNGSRCGSYTGELDWSFNADGRLVVTFGAAPGRR